MLYNSLRHLILKSASSRKFFGSLPRETQRLIRKDNYLIHSQLDLRLKAEWAEALRRKKLA